MAKFKFTGAKTNRIKLLKCTSDPDGIKSVTGVRIEMCSNRSITIDGCKGIVEYNGEYVTVKTIGGSISVFGKSLLIPVFEGAAISISGRIDSINFDIR